MLRQVLVRGGPGGLRLPWLAALERAADQSFSTSWGLDQGGSRGLHTSRRWEREEQGASASALPAAAEAAGAQPFEAAELVAAAPLEAGPDAAALVEFTPDQSFVGGTLIGLAAASKLGLTGARRRRQVTRPGRRTRTRSASFLVWASSVQLAHRKTAPLLHLLPNAA